MLQPPTPPTPPPGTYVLQDVHGAGAQRSDLKTGDPNDYPQGHGPQGDVVRIFNYVRAVRDAGVAPTPTPLPVGGMADVQNAAGESSSTAETSGDSPGLFIAVAGTAAGLFGLAGGAWYLRRRRSG